MLLPLLLGNVDNDDDGSSDGDDDEDESSGNADGDDDEDRSGDTDSVIRCRLVANGPFMNSQLTHPTHVNQEIRLCSQHQER